MSNDYIPWSERKAALVEGDESGWLTVVEWGEKQCKCRCRCGKYPVIRSTVNLNASRVKAQVPMCKDCDRSERKRKNPCGGAGNKALRSDILAYSGVLRS